MVDSVAMRHPAEFALGLCRCDADAPALIGPAADGMAQLALLRAALDQSREAVYVVEAQGRLLFANQACRASLGYLHDEMPALTLADIDPDWDGDRWAALWLELRARRSLTLIGRYRTRDGRELEAEHHITYLVHGERGFALAFARKLPHAAGHPAPPAVPARDEGERAALEALVRERTASLEALAVRADAANRAKGEVLSVVSHEIRTTLSGVIGMTELLSATHLDPDQRRFVEAAKVSGRHLLDLLDDVLDVAKLEAHEIRLSREPVSLPALIAEVLAPFVGRAAIKGLALYGVAADGTPQRVWSDALRLRQVLINLVGNAIKFTHRGNVRLALSCTRPAGASSSAAVTLGFEVIDTGIGIPAEALGRIFEPFAQADGATARLYGGTGLGLAIAARLVRLMGGELAVESRPEHGSRFHFAIPVEAVEEPASLQDNISVTDEPIPPADRQMPGLLALVVDDNAVNQEVARAMLGRFGIRPQVADNGHEAITLAAAQAFDIIFMDCVMPVLGGHDAARRIRTIEADDPSMRPAVIVALTADTEPADIERCLAAGMDDYIAKPVSMAALRRVLDRWCAAVADRPAAPGGSASA